MRYFLSRIADCVNNSSLNSPSKKRLVGGRIGGGFWEGLFDHGPSPPGGAQTSLCPLGQASGGAGVDGASGPGLRRFRASWRVAGSGPGRTFTSINSRMAATIPAPFPAPPENSGPGRGLPGEQHRGQDYLGVAPFGLQELLGMTDCGLAAAPRQRARLPDNGAPAPPGSP